MLTDMQISGFVRHGLGQAPVPEFTLTQGKAPRHVADVPIRHRMRTLPRMALASCAIVVVFIAMGAVSPAFYRSIQNGYSTMLRMAGYPVLPLQLPQHIRMATAGRPITLAQAQERVSYTLVAPQGLPSDVVRSIITANHGAIWNEKAQTWTVGAVAVIFEYFRKDGRMFVLISRPYREGSHPSFVRDIKSDASGHVSVVPHREFLWRNGNQTLMAVEGKGISAHEITQIREAMHGIPLPQP